MSSTATVRETTQVFGTGITETPPLAEKLFRAACLALTLLFPALICLSVAYVAEPDIWWHLASGDWILAHHTFPRVDTFSSTTMGHPWQAYSWLFELLLSGLYAHLGLAGIVCYTATMTLVITAALFQLVYATEKSLRLALPLTVAAAFALLTLSSPRPWHFTILFFVIELAFIQIARREGRTRKLWFLPVMFALWANIHIQFIDGLLLLALVAAESLLFSSSQRNNGQAVTRIPSRTALLLLAACLAATLINPYGWRIYSVAHDLASQSGVVNGIEELKAMPFRAVSNFVVLFLALGAAAKLGRAGKFRFFETVLLFAACALSFHSQRDIWIVVTVSVLILAAKVSPTDEGDSPALGKRFLAGAFGIAAVLLFGAARMIHLSDATLEPKLAKEMPVSAANFVREHHLSGPVFCDFIWGGYLIHSLGMPVSIDGRAALHGDAQLDLSARTWAGAPDWDANPQLNSAGVIIAPNIAALTQLLNMDHRFERVYADKLASVFVPRTPIH